MAGLCVAVLICTVSVAWAEQLPASLRGTWRITRILPTTNSGCWTPEQAQSLVGTTLTYSQNQMRWRGGAVRVEDIYTRVVSAEDFSKENAGPEPASFAQLGVRAAELVEVDMQHEDAAVLPASTEVPGDSVLMVAPERIVVSACGVYYEATHARSLERASLARSGHVRSSGR
jgi:hypothetical protein